jgi:type 1 fimbria pilin
MDIFMKKTIISGVVVSIMAMSMGTAMASSMSSELSVKGKMAIPSCEVSLTNDGVYNLGQIASGAIDPTKTKQLKDINGELIVRCEADTFLNFSAIDNREGTASSIGNQHFGLGQVNGSGKLGYYKMKFFGGYVDAVDEAVYSENKGSTTVESTHSVYVEKGKVTGWATRNNTQASGKYFKAILAVEPVLGSLQDMGGTPADGTKLDGSATLSFSYAL